jgi:hypothetical protein
MSAKLKYLIILILLVTNACRNRFQNPMETPLAVVGDKHLYASELASVIPDNLTYSDSAAKASDYITKWVRRELMLKRAEENLTVEQKDVIHELEEYRASLIIHRYQQELVKQRLDTTVTEKDIQDFYERNNTGFILQQNIVKGIYLEVNKSVDSPKQTRKWMNSDEEEPITELETYSYQYATKFDYFVERWVDFSLIESRIPIKVANTEQFLKRKKLVEISDTTNNYYLSIREFKLIGEKAPYNFVKDQIENLILNNRKMELIKELERNVLEKGKEENLYTIIE